MNHVDYFLSVCNMAVQKIESILYQITNDDFRAFLLEVT